MKPIAVIASNVDTAIEWLMQTKRVTEIKVKIRLVRDKENSYIIVINKEQALENEWSDYLIVPGYESLLDVVKARIR